MFAFYGKIELLTTTCLCACHRRLHAWVFGVRQPHIVNNLDNMMTSWMVVLFEICISLSRVEVLCWHSLVVLAMMAL
jgi:hypothetical protein